MRRGICQVAAAARAVGFSGCPSLRHSTTPVTTSTSTPTPSTPSTPGTSSTSSTVRSRAAVGSGSGVPPPRPPSYTPPEERPAGDASLQFRRSPSSSSSSLPSSSSSSSSVFNSSEAAGVRLGPGQAFAPELPRRPVPSKRYVDEAAANLETTSVFAGHSLLPDEDEAMTSNLATLRNSTQKIKKGDDSKEAPFIQARRRSSIFDSEDQVNSIEEDRKVEKESIPSVATLSGEKGNDATDEKSKRENEPTLQQMERDLRRLEYYQGSPQYPQLLQEFRDKYGVNNNEDVSKSDKFGDRLYTQEELSRGLEAQPIDYLRTTKKLKVELSSGPRAYDPVVVMQQHGVMQFQGYAFPPTIELGKLRDSDGNVVDTIEDKKLLKEHIRQNMSSDLKKRLDGGKDNHIVHRVLGLDAIQRRQVRAMLSDFDYADRHTAFHVMMSYPYTDWLHVFYMVMVGLALYNFQVRYGAYEFYDEYLGLDLRQVPTLKKPFLAVMTTLVMVVFLFKPLLIASIATTRFYRIALRRPIGPP
ncbi:uncharacterized protein TM35_000092150 [Trypanosoma theileri]|uniref:Transmembrane protein n=1 Tax=Trypanosoma theileri TaxID=67003 RepID=A0A1X0NZR0_9TRYP|nr:uncharacterized protein TM35_000092150 [Trypanosoma theileri]ORC90165.1 hypothetical protein TM35_000092150 [Trypanosoma theileri]